MESLFKLSELETRIPINMNVLVDGVTPRVVSLGEALQQWLDHRRDGAAAPLAASAGGDRAAARTARRHDRRLPQSRRGDPHHPRGRRAEGALKARFALSDDAGQLRPRHAAAQPAPARGNGAAQGAGRPHARRRRRSRRCSRSDKKQWQMIARRDPRHSRRNTAPTPSSASGARPSRPRRMSSSPTSPRR